MTDNAIAMTVGLLLFGPILLIIIYAIFNSISNVNSTSNVNSEETDLEPPFLIKYKDKEIKPFLIRISESDIDRSYIMGIPHNEIYP